MLLSLRTSLTRRAALASAVSTIVVVAFKLVAAGLSSSIAVLAEAIQSTLDVALSLAVVWAVKVSAKPPDEDHPYGHGKAEILLSAFQMVVVICTASMIAWQAALSLHDPRPIKPGWGMAAMAYAVVANSLMVVYLKSVSKRTQSAALEGEAEHLRGDVFASLGVLGGLIAYAATGWKQIDPAVAILFTLAGIYFAIQQLRKLLHPLMDGALPSTDLKTIEQTLDSHPECRGFHNVRTRQSGHLRIVMLHVLLDDNLSFVDAHDTAEQLEAELSLALGGALVTIHFEPFEAETLHRSMAHGGDSLDR